MPENKFSLMIGRLGCPIGHNLICVATKVQLKSYLKE